MKAIVFSIPNVVEEVTGAADCAEQDESQEAAADRRGRREAERKDERRKDQQVLGPLLHAELGQPDAESAGWPRRGGV
jgi:hypothetical protein